LVSLHLLSWCAALTDLCTDDATMVSHESPWTRIPAALKRFMMTELVTSKMLVAWLEIRDVKMLRMRSGVPKREYRRSRVLCSLCGSHEHLAFLIGWTIVEGKDLHQNRRSLSFPSHIPSLAGLGNLGTSFAFNFEFSYPPHLPQHDAHIFLIRYSMLISNASISMSEKSYDPIPSLGHIG